tara:strand:+ start:6 stop:557 length:552 start_codon:yes stop_codon:yes gene_type:complete
MLKNFFILVLLFFFNYASATEKEKIISNFEKINNLSFDFEQNINGKIEKGNCIIQYQKKIFCKYSSKNNKILVSNGKSIVIKTDSGSYYLYPLKSTPLNLILDKKFLLEEINKLKSKENKKHFLIYSISRDGTIIDVFFDKKNYYLNKWQILDIYQNLSVTHLSKILINQEIDQKIFILPKSN